MKILKWFYFYFAEFADREEREVVASECYLCSKNRLYFCFQVKGEDPDRI
jgi:hypothetical protein